MRQTLDRVSPNLGVPLESVVVEETHGYVCFEIGLVFRALALRQGSCPAPSAGFVPCRFSTRPRVPPRPRDGRPCSLLLLRFGCSWGRQLFGVLGASQFPSAFVSRWPQVAGVPEKLRSKHPSMCNAPKPQFPQFHSFSERNCDSNFRKSIISSDLPNSFVQHLWDLPDA